MIALLAGMSISRTHAAEPAVNSIIPTGAALGTSATLTLRGSNLQAPLGLWTSWGTTLDPPMSPAESATNELTTITLDIPPDCPLGIHGLRLVNAQGVGPWKLFVVDDLPTVLSSDTNHSLQTAQQLTPPCAVDGQLAELNRDFYRFDVTRGQTISLEVLSRRLGSSLDPVLFLYDSTGREIAYIDDSEGMSGDGQLVHTFDVDGSCSVEVRDIRYSGGPAFTYRLRIGDFPCLNGTHPLSVDRGTRTRVDFAGISCDDADPVWVDVPTDWPHDWWPVSTHRPGGSSSAFSTVHVGNGPMAHDQEPNNTFAQANVVDIGQSIQGRFDRDSDQDRFRFQASKGQQLSIAGVTRDYGSPTDLLMSIEDASGTRLVEVDDTDAGEGMINFAPPADGEYCLVLADLHRRGGPQYTYQVDLTVRTPGFRLSADADRFQIPAGGPAGVLIKAQRQDFDGPITLVAVGLPDDITATPTVIGPGQQSAWFTLSATAALELPRVIPLTIVGTAQIGDREVRKMADVTDVIQSQLQGLTMVPPCVRTSFAGAVVPAAPFSLKIEPEFIACEPGKSTTVRVIAQRTDGFDAEVSLSTRPEKDALPPHVKLELKPIPGGASETELTLTAENDARPGTYSLGLMGTHKKDNQETTVSSRGISLLIQPAETAEAAKSTE